MLGATAVAAVLCCCAGFCGTHVVRLLKAVTQGFEAISELVIILAGSWFLVRWKDRLVTRILERTRRVK